MIMHKMKFTKKKLFLEEELDWALILAPSPPHVYDELVFELQIRPHLLHEYENNVTKGIEKNIIVDIILQCPYGHGWTTSNSNISTVDKNEPKSFFFFFFQF